MDRRKLNSGEDGEERISFDEYVKRVMRSVDGGITKRELREPTGKPGIENISTWNYLCQLRGIVLLPCQPSPVICRCSPVFCQWIISVIH